MMLSIDLSDECLVIVYGQPAKHNDFDYLLNADKCGLNRL